MFEKYLQYIKNTGGSPTIAQFDDDWEPIGLMVRRDMGKSGLIIEKEGRLYIKETANSSPNTRKPK